MGASDSGFQAYLRSLPCDVHALLLRGLSYKRLGELPRALAEFSALIDIDPSNGSAYIRRWEVYQALGESAKAAADLAKGRALLNSKASST